MEPTVPALPDEPERAAVADVARPLDQGVVRLDHDKRVRAVTVACECHLGKRSSGFRRVVGKMA